MAATETSKKMSSASVQSAVYGTLAAAIAIAGEAHDSRRAMAGTIVFTLVVYAVTHAYMHAVAAPRASVRHGSIAMLHAVRAEWPLVAAGIPMLLALAFASAVDLNLDRSAELALGTAVIVMFGWGVAASSQAETGWRRFSVGLFAAGLGLLVVFFAVWLRH